jgi:RNA polymerase sigma factor (sigma-70 family)
MPRHDQDFAAFVTGIEPRLISFLTYFCGSSHDAEELFQEALMEAHRNWPEVAKADAPEAWVMRVARNKAINRFKRRDTERKHLALLPGKAPEQPGAPLEQQELQAAVQQALDTLPQQERECLCLKVWGELSWVQISRTLDVSEDTAARLFARALKKVAPALKELA